MTEENLEQKKINNNKNEGFTEQDQEENAARKETDREEQHIKDKEEEKDLENNSDEKDENVTEDDKEEVDELTEEELKNKIEELEETIVELKDENEGYYRNLARLKADFNNYRRRAKKEKTGLTLEGKIELIEEILPVIDNFERALDSEDENSEFKEGVELIYRQLINALKQEGLEEIQAEGEPFDHRCHEAIMQVKDTDEESGIVVEELQKGYIFNDKVIRPAMVKVAQ